MKSRWIDRLKCRLALHAWTLYMDVDQITMACAICGVVSKGWTLKYPHATSEQKLKRFHDRLSAERTRDTFPRLVKHKSQ